MIEHLCDIQAKPEWKLKLLSARADRFVHCLQNIEKKEEERNILLPKSGPQKKHGF